MFGFIKSVGRAVVDTAALPVDLVRDVGERVVSPSRSDRYQKSRTERRLEEIEEDLEDAADELW